MIPCHPLSSLCTTTVDPVCLQGIFVSISSFDWGCLFIGSVRLLSLLHRTGGLLKFVSIPVIGQLNRSVSWPGNTLVS